ncbi:hypothetical protein [Pendulispora albinea]|uniref:Secreted protein n=1 Tax=Pendulispora albinea TaxID=2741071 RepID=A0ABZ2LU05_9BACT
MPPEPEDEGGAGSNFTRGALAVAAADCAGGAGTGCSRCGGCCLVPGLVPDEDEDEDAEDLFAAASAPGFAAAAFSGAL